MTLERITDGYGEEFALRLADIADVLDSVTTDEDGELSAPNSGALLSALDYALRGSSGCVEPDEWEERRSKALRHHAEYLGIRP